MIAASFCLFYALILMVKNNIKQLVIRQMCMLIMQKECLCRFFNFVNFLTSDRDSGPRSIYQYSNMAPRLSSQTSIFGVAFFVSKSLLGIEGQRKLEKFAILTRKPRSHVRILIYRTWLIPNLFRKEFWKLCLFKQQLERRTGKVPGKLNPTTVAVFWRTVCKNRLRKPV